MPGNYDIYFRDISFPSVVHRRHRERPHILLRWEKTPLACREERFLVNHLGQDFQRAHLPCACLNDADSSEALDTEFF